MKITSRIARIEAQHAHVPYQPPIIIFSVVEPSDHGPKEVGAFVNLFINGEDNVFWRNDGENNGDFIDRVKAIEAQG